MAAIYLIRHGQASFDQADYDHLSETGFQQAKILGDYWRALPYPPPDKIYRGNMLRHQQTMADFLSAYQQPELATITHPGFNEFDHVDVLKRYRRDWSGFSTSTDFEEEFAGAFQRWLSGDYDADYAESWPQFKQRCITALQALIAQSGTAKTILVFTSGGTISVILQHILQLTDQHTLRLNQQIRNASLTRLLFSTAAARPRLSVDYTNNFSHLEQAGHDWVTYR